MTLKNQTAPCGHLNVTFNEREQLFAKGLIDTLELRLPLRVSPIPEIERGASEQAPSHHVDALLPDRQVRIGVAWAKKVERGDRAGQLMLSMNLKDPSLPSWANNLTAFPRDAGKMQIVYDRSRQPLPSAQQIADNQEAMDAAGAA